MQDTVKPAYEAYIKKPNEKTLETLQLAMRETPRYQAPVLMLQIMNELTEMGGYNCEQWNEQDVELLLKIKALLSE